VEFENPQVGATSAADELGNAREGRVAAEREALEKIRREEEQKLALERASIQKMRDDMERERLANEKVKQALDDAKNPPVDEPPVEVQQTVYAGEPKPSSKKWRVKVDLEVSGENRDSVSSGVSTLLKTIGADFKIVNVQEIK
jgi:hypothetical protein